MQFLLIGLGVGAGFGDLFGSGRGRGIKVIVTIQTIKGLVGAYEISHFFMHLALTRF